MYVYTHTHIYIYTHTHCEMIITVKLMNTFMTSHSYHFLWGSSENTLKIYSQQMSSVQKKREQTMLTLLNVQWSAWATY